MQNIPGIPLETDEKTAVRKITAARKNEQHELFANLFNEHADMVENELSLAPVSSQDKMMESAPAVSTSHSDTESSRASIASEKPTKTVTGNKTADVAQDDSTSVHDNDSRISEEEFEEIKDDLEAYGMTEEEISEMEDKVKSDEGMTWGQMVAAIAQKIAANRTAGITDDQKVELKSFFSKFGFNEKESNKLISQLEKGDFTKVMKALQAKIDAMPDGKQMLFEKTEIEAFTSALGFSSEFTSKIKELLGNNTLPKDVKQAFTMIRQEMAAMDKKDQELIKAVGKEMAKAMGDESKATTVARQIAEAVDLKPRVAEEKTETAEIKDDLAQAVKNRKDALPENSTRKATQESLTSKAEIKTDTPTTDTATDKKDAENESGDGWDNMFNKMSEDTSGKAGAQTRTERAEAASLSKTGVTELAAETKKANTWEKVSAPKVMKQVDNAVLKSLKNGVKQLTLQLTPENLGKLSVMLQVNGKEVGATIRAENADAAKIITDNLHIIKQSLESQGLKVDKLDVQTGLANDQSFNDWFGENEHNLAREREVMIAMRNHMKQMRGDSGDMLAQDLQQVQQQAIHAAQGLHIIA